MLSLAANDHPQPAILKFSAPTMGTILSVQLAGMEASGLQEIARAVYHAVDQVDRQMSTYKPESDLCRFNNAPLDAWVSVAAGVVQVVEEALRIGHLSKGAFDIAVFDLVDGWGFGPSKTPRFNPLLKQATAPEMRATYKDILVRHEPPALRKVRALSADLSGIAKGFGVDEAARILAELGVDNYLVEIAGEIRAAGAKPSGASWTLGLELPIEGRRVVHDQLTLRDCAIATSGTYRQFHQVDGQTYSHTMDPSSAMPILNRSLAINVAADTCMEADALATVLMVLPIAAATAFCEEHAIAARFVEAQKDGFKETRSNEFVRRFA